METGACGGADLFVGEAASILATGVSVKAEAFQWRLPSKPELVEGVVMALKDRAESCGLCDEENVTRLVVSLTEAITNAVVHGNLEISSEVRERTDGEYGRMLAERCADPKYAEREVVVDVRWDGETCAWTIRDQGQGFDVAGLLAKLDTEEPSELASGRGILLMRAFMDEVTWSAGGREVRMTMTKAGCEGGEKKAKIRHGVRASEEGRTVEAVATGVSTMGMDLLARGLTTAKRLVIEMEVEGKKTLVPAEVRHVTALAGDWVQIDCRFEKGAGEANVVGADVIERLLAGARRGAVEGSERRTSERFAYTDGVRVERKDGTVLQGVARDLSRGGMAFIGSFDLERGEILRVTLEGEKTVAVRLVCEVIRVQHLTGEYWDLGVRFVTGAEG